jgi:hypothetical protein
MTTILNKGREYLIPVPSAISLEVDPGWAAINSLTFLQSSASLADRSTALIFNPFSHNDEFGRLSDVMLVQLRQTANLLGGCRN